MTETLDAYRLAQLRRDMQLTPEERVLVAEQTLRNTEPNGRPRREFVLTFDSYEDYLDWKHSPRRLRGC